YVRFAEIFLELCERLRIVPNVRHKVVTWGVRAAAEYGVMESFSAAEELRPVAMGAVAAFEFSDLVRLDLKFPEDVKHGTLILSDGERARKFGPKWHRKLWKNRGLAV